MRYHYTLFQLQTSSMDDQSLFWTKENDLKDGHYNEFYQQRAVYFVTNRTMWLAIYLLQ